MKLVSANTNFRAEAKFAAISKSRGRVPVNRGGIDLVEEFLSPRGVAGDDDIAMMRATFFHVRDRVFDVVYGAGSEDEDRKSTRLNSSHSQISYAVFCLKKKKTLTALATTCQKNKQHSRSVPFTDQRSPAHFRDTQLPTKQYWTILARTTPPCDLYCSR